MCEKTHLQDLRERNDVSKPTKGFTLIELMVTIAVLAILLAMAAPSFAEFAERQALRGTADNIIGVIGLAKEEAAKRDRLVQVDFIKLGDGVCAGAAVGTAGCDCSAGTCPLAASAASERDLKGVRITGDPLFGGDGAFVIDPKTGTLLDLADSGAVDLETQRGYGLRIRVNPLARASTCTPDGKKSLPGVAPCAP